MRLSEMVSTRFVAMLWGPPKVGKTVLASQFPNPHFIDLDKGITSVLAMTRVRNLEVDFPVYQIDDGPCEDPDVVKLVGPTIAKRDGWTITDKLIRELLRTLPFDSTLIIDNITRLGEYLVSNLKRSYNRQQLQIQDWGEFVSRITFLMDAIHSAAYKPNVIIIAHEQLIKDELSGRIERVILLPTSQKHRVPTVVGDLWYLTMTWRGKEAIRLLRTSVDRQTSLGSRMLIPDIEEPTYEKMRPYISRALGRELPEPTWTP